MQNQSEEGKLQKVIKHMWKSYNISNSQLCASLGLNKDNFDPSQMAIRD